jgi:hypothetical protein
VHDALSPAAGRVQGNAEIDAVPLQRLELLAGERVADRPRLGRDVVVHRRDREVGTAHRAASQPQRLERLRAGDLVDEVQIDVEQRGLARPLLDDVRLPDLLEQGLGAHGSNSIAS